MLFRSPLVTPKDKTPIKLLTLAFFPLNSMLTSDLKDEALAAEEIAKLIETLED